MVIRASQISTPEQDLGGGQSTVKTGTAMQYAQSSVDTIQQDANAASENLLNQMDVIKARDDSFWAQDNLNKLASESDSFWSDYINSVDGDGSGSNELFLSNYDKKLEQLIQNAPSEQARQILRMNGSSLRETYNDNSRQWEVEQKFNYRSQRINDISDDDTQNTLRSIRPHEYSSGRSFVGSVSAKYESRGNYGAHGYDTRGGHSYGKYQFSHNRGSLKEFLNFAKERGSEDLVSFINNSGPVGSKSYNAAFSEASKQKRFQRLQHDFISENFYKPTEQHAKSIGIDVNDQGIKEMMWSLSVQHGQGGARSILSRAKKNSTTNDDVIRNVYAIRRTQFNKATPQERSAVLSRFDREEKEVLALSGTVSDLSNPPTPENMNIKSNSQKYRAMIDTMGGSPSDRRAVARDIERRQAYSILAKFSEEDPAMLQSAIYSGEWDKYITAEQQEVLLRNADAVNEKNRAKKVTSFNNEVNLRAEQIRKGVAEEDERFSLDNMIYTVGEGDANIHNITLQKAASEYEANKFVGSATDEEIITRRQELESALKTKGMNTYEKTIALNAFEAHEKAMAERSKNVDEDAALFSIQNNENAKAAVQEFSKTPTKETFKTMVDASLIAQSELGIPENKQRILSKTVSQSFSNAITEGFFDKTTEYTSDEAKKSAASLAYLKSISGDKFNAVLNEMIKDGTLPDSFLAVASISDFMPGSETSAILLAQKGSKDIVEISASFAAVGQNPLASSLIFGGIRATENKGLISMKEEELNDAVLSVLGDTYSANPYAESAIISATKALYSANIPLGSEFNYSLFRRTAKEFIGDKTRINGYQTAVPIGANVDSFRRAIQDMPESYLDGAVITEKNTGKQKQLTKDDIKRLDLRFAAIGGGKYFLLDGIGNPIKTLNKEGLMSQEPFTLDYEEMKQFIQPNNTPLYGGFDYFIGGGNE